MLLAQPDAQVQLVRRAKPEPPVIPVEQEPLEERVLLVRRVLDLLEPPELQELRVQPAELVKLVRRVRLETLAQLELRVRRVLPETPEPLVRLE